MEPASSELQHGLQTLQIASERELQNCRGRVRRLAQGLPAFDSVWIDALVEQKLLTPFQAKLFEDKRWTDLQVNSDIILQDQIHFDRVMPLYRAIHKHEKTQFLVCRIHSDRVDSQTAKRLSGLIQQNQTNETNSSLAIDFHCPPDRSTVDVISSAVEGHSLCSLLVRRGRFPEQVVRSIAVMVCRALARHDHHILHGDLRLSNILIGPNGQVELLNSGILNALMPALNIHEQLPADAYDGIAPERFDTSQATTTASDLYALGCMMWHLMAGRPPHLFADPLAKIAAHRQQEIKDIREVVPDCSEEMAQILLSLTSRRVLNRPKSFEILEEKLRGGGDRFEERLQQFVDTFESRAPRHQTSEPTRNSSIFSKAAVAVLLTAITLGVFWNRAQLGLPNLTEVAASSSTIGNEETDISPLKFKPIQTASVDTEVNEPTLPIELGSSLLKLPEANDEGVINLDQPGPYRLDSLKSDQQIILRSHTDVISKVVLDSPHVNLTSPYIEFQNIDFEVRQSDQQAPFSLRLHSQELRLDGCHFQTEANKTGHFNDQALVSWDAIDAEAQTSGRLLISNCVSSTHHALLATKSPISTALFQNVLQLTPAALVKITAGAKAGMLVPIVFNSCTHSSASPVIVIRANNEFEAGGKISVQGSNSIFASSAETPLIGIVDGDIDSKLSKNLEFSAQGLIVHSNAMLIGSDIAANGWETIDSPDIKIDGLLSGRFRFELPHSFDSSSRASIPDLVIEELPIRTSQERPGFQYATYEQSRATR